MVWGRWWICERVGLYPKCWPASLWWICDERVGLYPKCRPASLWWIHHAMSHNITFCNAIYCLSNTLSRQCSIGPVYIERLITWKMSDLFLVPPDLYNDVYLVLIHNVTVHRCLTQNSFVYSQACDVRTRTYSHITFVTSSPPCRCFVLHLHILYTNCILHVVNFRGVWSWLKFVKCIHHKNVSVCSHK